jgi:hypothetical protein
MILVTGETETVGGSGDSLLTAGEQVRGKTLRRPSPPFPAPRIDDQLVNRR